MVQALALRVMTEASEERTVALPMPPMGFAITAACLFLLLLAVTYSFRSIGHRHSPQAYQPLRNTGFTHTGEATRSHEPGDAH